MTEKRDVVTFMTKDIESVWSSLQAQGCRISDIEIQNKTLLDSLFDSTKGGQVMKALLEIEWIKTWRSWPVFIMSIGMPVGFFPLVFRYGNES